MTTFAAMAGLGAVVTIALIAVTLHTASLLKTLAGLGANGFKRL